MKTENEEIQRYKAEIEKLKNQVLRFDELFDTALEPCLIIDEHQSIVFVNQGACELFGMTKKELISLHMDDLLKDANKKLMLQNNGEFSGEWQIGWNEEIQYISARVATLSKENLTYIRLKDVTVEKRQKQDKAISRKMLSGIFNQAIDSILIYDSEGIIVDANKAFCMNLGLAREQLIGENVEKFVTLEYIETWKRSMENVRYYGSSRCEIDMTAGFGVIKFEYIACIEKYNGYYMSILRNITDKYIIEKDTNKNEEFFSSMIEQTLDAILFFDKNGTVFRVNEAGCNIFGIPRETLLGTNITEYLMERDKKILEIHEQLFKYGEVKDELFFKMSEDKAKLLEFTAKAQRSEGFYISIFRDITDRKNMEKKLRESEARFRKIFEGSLDGLILWDKDGFSEINEVGANILEMSKEVLLSKTLTEIIEMVQENTPKLMAHIEQTLKEKMYKSTIPITFKDGKIKHIEISSRANLHSGMNLTIFRDVTKTLELQEQLRKSDTLNVVGELAAGIAHEIRNPMTALKGFVQLLQSSVKDDYSMYFNVINSELKRIESIITQFLVLAKPQALKYLKQDVCGVMKETLDLLSAQALMQNIQFESSLDEVFLIYCEGNQLKQVFINIIKNAIEVMPSGGIIKVAIKKQDEEFIRISIEDQGGGIPEEKIKRLGEPFYTTKERGTGLGLMVSYKIIEEHIGCIDVESEIGKGTIFHIYLPIKREMEEI